MKHSSALRLVWISLLILTALPPTSARGDWPQFRGQNASGLDSRAAAPVAWNIETGENVGWTVPIPGLSHASPIVFSNRVYLITAIGPGDSELKIGLYGDIAPVAENSRYEWRVLALDLASGNILWNVPGHAAIPRVKRHPKASHANSTPATDGRHIVALFGSEGLFCFDMNGKKLWTKDLGPMDSGYFASPTAQWGFASSPVLHDGKVIVLCDVQTNSFLAAFEAATGRELWRTPRSDVPTWGTPAVIDAAGRKQIVVNGWHHSGGYEFASGREIWRLKGGGDIPVPTPILSEGLIFLTSAHGRLRPMRAIRATASGDITPSDPAGTNAAIAWVHPRQGNYMQTPIVVGKNLYGCTDSGVVTCFETQSGKIIYSERLPSGKGYTASPVSDGRHLYFASEPGMIYVVPAGETFRIVATNDLRESCMATPALSDGTLLVRTQKRLAALRGRSPATIR